ncbi:MAG: hypothetical protein N4A57_15525 [Anaeromicrobium sp.]|jgi:hypothetical protein|uniref:hypothetical protein n=1 Tax=Anaeromicrobium sp. TaxID=1929132 RepID=UPI0025DCD823|nr:hypothetical protein [Anaeromicrobium sp.]MCT4595658.1 hypothetical protein [Anaeromicrobium sp.]
MQGKVRNIKRVATHIEWAMTIGNKEKLINHIEEMMSLCNEVKAGIMEEKKPNCDINVEVINEIPFLYKPILKKDYYEGTYLEDFGEQRSEDLKLSKAMNNHNKFWQSYEIIKGNIFGSVPKELLSEDSIRDLKRFGWDECTVNVIDVLERKCDFDEMIKFCESEYGKYVIVKEKSSEVEMILHYMMG